MKRPSSGFAIVSVLLVLAVLTIMVVAFMQSMRIDRLTARAYLNKASAEAVARAGVSEAIERVRQTVLDNPFHAVGYFRPTTLSTEDAAWPVIYGSSDINTSPQYFYLASSPDINTPPDYTNPDEIIDLNALNSTSETYGWIGSPVKSNGTVGGPNQQNRANWVYILRDPTLPEQPDPNQNNYNPVVGRFAFWVEDETSKVNYRVSGNADDSNGAFERSDLSNQVEDIDLGALPLRPQPGGVWRSLGFDAASGAINQSLVTMFDSNQPASKIFDPRIINRNSALNPNLSTGGTGTDFFEVIKYHATTYSKSLNTNRFGKPRINLNALVTNNSTDPNLPASDEDIEGDLADIIVAMTGRLGNLYPNGTNRILPDEYQPEPSPNFGLRFFQNASDPDPNSFGTDEVKYLTRLAANIRDYIDSDRYPTIVDFSGQVASLTNPTPPPLAWRGNEEPYAVGKEAIPYFQEHMWRGREVRWISLGSSRVRYVVKIDHYFELFNPHTKDFTFPVGSRIHVYNQPTWQAGTFPPLNPGDLLMDLSGVTVRAGRALTVTSDPNPPSSILDSGAILSVPLSSGTTSFGGLTDEPIGGDIGLQLAGRDSSLTDYQTEMVLFGPHGIYQSHPYIAISLGFSTQWNMKGNDLKNSSTRFFYSSSLRGNDSPDRTGDPRSLNEQMTYRGGASSLDGGAGTQTRFYGGVTQTLSPSDHTLGRASISYVNPRNWPDYANNFQNNAATAFAVVRDGPMQSVGELGHIYDPYRIASSRGITYSRGGGRTLRIGQAEDVLNPLPRFTDSWKRSAWQLTDTFGVDPDSTLETLPLQNEAHININGVLRDGGTAFKAVLRNMEFLASPDSDPDLSGDTLTDDEINMLVTSIEDYIDDNGPIMHRGELSEISYFDAEGSANPEFAGEQTDEVNDRGREEVFRRLVELVNTRSTTYTVYAVGDAIQQNSNGSMTRVARQRYQVLFELVPENPGNANQIITILEPRTIHESL